MRYARTAPTDLDELQLGVLRDSRRRCINELVRKVSRCNILVKRFHNTEHRDNNVDGAVALIPQVVELVHGPVNVAFETCSNHGLHCDWMWLVAHFEDVVARYETKPRPRGLQVVDSLTHVSFGSKDEGLQTFVTVLNLEGRQCRLMTSGVGYATFSISQISSSRFKTSVSRSLA